MTSVEIARIYTDLVKLDQEIPDSEQLAKSELAVLRSKYHQLLMDAFRAEGIEFIDRADARRIAFELVANEQAQVSSFLA